MGVFGHPCARSERTGGACPRACAVRVADAGVLAAELAGWASRWDLYLYMGDDQIHWFSIINSLAIVLLLTGIVAMIMMRTLRRDFNKYNEQDKEDLQEESGWKLVHADVLRPPPQPILLCASLGTGMQLLIMGILSSTTC